MMNQHNKKLAEQARKRRAMFYRLHTRKKSPLSGVALAKLYHVSKQRMQFILRLAESEL